MMRAARGFWCWFLALVLRLLLVAAGWCVMLPGLLA